MLSKYILELTMNDEGNKLCIVSSKCSEKLGVFLVHILYEKEHL
jgi:hypothetical protein